MNHYTIRYNATNGSEIWNKLGPIGIAYSIATDNQGFIYVTGVSNNNYFTMKYNSANGAQIWNTTYDSGGSDIARGITLDSSQNIYVTGNANGNFTTVKYNSSGSYMWNITDAAGTAYGIAVDNQSNIYAAGVSSGNYYTVKYANSTSLSDTIYPLFSNYSDNSGTLTSSGIAWFNITILNTNGTVLLQINSVNYSAINLTVDVYNVSISLSSSGTYSYNWISWGNGTSHNLNVSETRSYIVNAPSGGSSGGDSNGGGGGTGGGNATKKNCTLVLDCGEWSECINNTQIKKCDQYCNGSRKISGFFYYKRECDFESLLSNKSESSNADIFNKTKNSPEITFGCSEWSSCYVIYDLNDIIAGNVFFNGEKTRECKFNDGKISKEIEKCETRISITTKKVKKCSKNYLEVYDLSNKLIWRLELVDGIYKKYERINLEINMDGFDYCNYCYNGIKDYDENEIDCVYEEAGNCPVCRKVST